MSKDRNPIDRLVDATLKRKVTLLAIRRSRDYWWMDYHDGNLAGKYPVRENYRDDVDYMLVVKAWKKKGKFRSALYKTFEDAIVGELTKYNG